MLLKVAVEEHRVKSAPPPDGHGEIGRRRMYARPSVVVVAVWLARAFTRHSKGFQRTRSCRVYWISFAIRSTMDFGVA